MRRVTAAAFGSIVVLFAVVIGACRPLPDITPGMCGNGVLEPGEDCDGFSSGGLACRPPDASGQCHLDCSPGLDGAVPACPAGFGCNPDHACRRATGAFIPLPQRVLGNARSLTSGDFDGDGRADVITQEQQVVGATKIRAHYFDRSAAPAHSWISNDLMSTPTLLTLPRDGRQSLATSLFGGVNVLTGEADGSLISEALPSYYLDGTDARVFGVLNEPIRNSVALVTLTERGGKRGLFRENSEARRLDLALELPFGVEDLAADPVLAKLFDDETLFPCRDIVLAARGADDLNVYSLCERLPKSGAVIWRDAPVVTRLPIPNGALVDQGLLAADLDGDDHLDLLLGTTGGNYVAYGNGAGFKALAPMTISFGDQGRAPTGMPLAAGDLSGDRLADFVFPNLIAMSGPGPDPGEIVYLPRPQQSTTRWTEAAIDDFNRDGRLDAVAISKNALDISFFLGTGTDRINLFTIPTLRTIDHLAVGDFDGDLINDVAVVQPPSAASGDADSEVAIAFGNLSGAPGAPRVTARVPQVRQILAFRNTPDFDVSFLGILYRQRGQGSGDGSALALLLGNTDRNLPCQVELTSFSSDGALEGGQAWGVTVGTFLTPGIADVLAFATVDDQDEPPGTPREFQLWLLPDIASRRGDPTLLRWSVPPELLPLVPLVPKPLPDDPQPDEPPKLTSTMASGDLDGDGLDELVFAGMSKKPGECLLFTAHVKAGDGPRVNASPPVVLDHPCDADTQMSVVDLDGDGARDVLVLFEPGSPGSRLLAFWGDGSGELDAKAFASLVPEGELPTAFTLLKGVSPEGLAVVYTTPRAVRILSARANERRVFDDTGAIVTLDRGTGIVAADVDGDGVKDLAIADDGAVRILRAELEAR